MHWQVAGAHGQVAGHRRCPASSATDSVKGTSGNNGHSWNLQVGLLQLQARPHEGGDGEQGTALPPAALHRERAHGGSVQFSHKSDQRDDDESRDRTPNKA